MDQIDGATSGIVLARQIKSISIGNRMSLRAPGGRNSCISRISRDASVSTHVDTDVLWASTWARFGGGKTDAGWRKSLRAQDKMTWGTNVTAEIATDGSKRLGRWGHGAKFALLLSQIRARLVHTEARAMAFA